MAKADMIAKEVAERLMAWSVDDVFRKWTLFALETSSLAYKTALEEAIKESDAKTALMHEFIESMVEAHERANKEAEEDLPVYTPIKRVKKDMR